MPEKSTAAGTKATSTANTTQPTQTSPTGFIASVDTSAVRRTDASALLALMQECTGEQPVMWGPSIIGFGEYHYKYASGREGDSAAVGFSPRKANLVIYGLTYHPGAGPLLEKLGKFKAGAACIYINKLADIDLDVLRELIREGYKHMTTMAIQSLQSQREPRQS